MNNKGIARLVKQRKREEAEQRQAAHNARTPQERLDVLIARGHGHCGEALSLKASLA